MAAFTIKQEKFEGPLDLLLTLIERRQLHVSDIALAKVADDFLGYAKSFAEFPLAEGSQFAYVASTLLLIKSKALLPQLSLSAEEEGSIEDIENRLRLLQRFRELSRHIRGRYGKKPLFLPLQREAAPVFAPPNGFSLSLILGAVQSVLSAIPKVAELSKTVIQKVISLEQMIEDLKGRIVSTLRMSFSEFAGAHRGERVHVIVGFLAMLELIKEGLITANQERPHGAIMMETGQVDTPRY